MIGVGPTTGHLVVGVLWLSGLLVTVVERRFPTARRVTFSLALAAVGSAALMAWLLWPGDAGLTLAGRALKLDGYALFVQGFVLAGAAFCLLLARHAGELWRPGSDGLLLLSAAGIALVAMAVDLIALLAGLVACLIPLLGLAVVRGRPEGREAALKGLVLGVLGMALLGLGSALLASRVGTTSLSGLHDYLSLAGFVGQDPLLVAALALVLSGLGIFLAVAPFHMLFTDVAEGLPSPASLLLCGCLLASGLAACGRVLLVGIQPATASGPGYLAWPQVLHAVGLIALLVGSAMALVQRRLKRLLACLAGSQAGLALIAMAAAAGLPAGPGGGQQRAVAGLLVFLAVHAVTWVGLYVAIGAIETEAERAGVGRLEGLARGHPWLAASVGLALLCMAGMPLTAGFFARLYLLEAMVAAGWIATAVAVVLGLGLVLVMSLGLVVAMFMRPAREDTQVRGSASLTLAAWLSSLAILALGILPGGVLELGLVSAAALFGG